MTNIDPKFRSLPHDPDDRYSVPWMAGTVGIVVDTSQVKETVHGYADVFSGKYRGRIVALSDAREWLGWALMHLGLPVNEVTPKISASSRCLGGLDAPGGCLRSDTAADVMIAGRADVALTWSGDAAVLLKASSKYKFILPQEGCTATSIVWRFLVVPIVGRKPKTSSTSSCDLKSA